MIGSIDAQIMLCERSEGRWETVAETEGEKIAPALDFAPLTDTVTQRVLAEINTISARN
jgi:hypothetical protein